MGLDDKIVKRYVRSTIYPVSGRRINPINHENQHEVIDFLLATSVDSFSYKTDIDPNGGAVTKTTVKQEKFDYEQEVIELYSEDELKLFQRLNRDLLVNGDLVEYNDKAPVID